MSAGAVPAPAGTPVVAGLFDAGGEEPALLGARCGGCGTTYFPAVAYCRNPACASKSVEPCRLPTRGTLYSFTVQRYQPPPLFRVDDWAPYAIGVVDLGEGLQVMGMLDGIAHDDIRIGMALRLVLASLYEEPGQGATLTYKFVPDDAAGARS